MGRGKPAMELIRKEKSRVQTFQKRKKGLIKKAHEFTTLCGVKMCMIIYGPQLDRNPLPGPDIWPLDPAQVRLIIDDFNDRKSRGTKTFALPDYFAQLRRKLADEIAKLRKANTAARFSPRWDDRFNTLSLTQIKPLIAKLDSIIDAAKARMMVLKSKSQMFEPDIPPAGLNLGFDVNGEKFGFSNQDMNLGEELICSQRQHVLNPYDHIHLQPPCWSFNPIPASNYNPMMMLAVNGLDFSQLGGASSSNSAYSPLSLSGGYDPAPITVGSGAFNELPGLGRYYGPSIEPLKVERQPSAMLSLTSQLQISQFNDFCRDMIEYEQPENKRPRARQRGGEELFHNDSPSLLEFLRPT